MDFSIHKLTYNKPIIPVYPTNNDLIARNFIRPGRASNATV